MCSRPGSLRVLSSAGLLVGALLMAAPGSAATWMPLDTYLHWEYGALGGAGTGATITGTTTLLGRTLAVRTFAGGPDDGLMNFWQTAPDGSVLLGGFDNPSAGFALVYDPPIVVLATPPALGLTWTTHTVAYEMTSMTVYATLDLQWEVLEDVTLDLPAGSFHAYGVGQVVPGGALALARAPGQSFTLDGHRLTEAAKSVPSDATDWYAEDVGVVQFRAGDLFQLTTFGAITANAGSSWGRIKRLYR